MGGIGLEVVKFLLSKSATKKKQEEVEVPKANASADEIRDNIRDELRGDVKTLREELRKVEEELDTWRGKYYTLMEQFLIVKSDLERALQKIKEEEGID